MADLFSSVFGSLSGAGSGALAGSTFGPIGTLLGAGIGAGAGLFGAQAGGAAIGGAARDATQARLNFYNQANGVLDPFLAAGRAALPGMQALTTPGQSASYLSSLPGYQFLLDQGSKIAQSGYAAQGLGSSGEALKGGVRFAEGLAGTNLKQFWDMLMQQVGVGQGAAQQMSANAMNTGAGIGENLLTAGKGWAAADMASGNAIATGANNLTSTQMQWNMIDKLIEAAKAQTGDKNSGPSTAAVTNPNLLNAAYAMAGFPMPRARPY